MITYLFMECFTKQFTKNYEYPDLGYFRNSVYLHVAPPPHVPPHAAWHGYEPSVCVCVFVCV